MLNKKIAVIGSQDTVLPFRTIGADSFQAESSQELAEMLRRLASEGIYGIIFVEENLAESVIDVVADINNHYRDVSVTPIPGASVQGGIALKRLGKQVTRAIGIDIFAQKGGS